MKMIDESTPIELLIDREFRKCKREECPIDIEYKGDVIKMKCQECKEEKQVKTFKDKRN